MRIEQRDNFECGAACIAMLTGHDIDEVQRRLGHRCADHIPGVEMDGSPVAFGTTDDEVLRYLWESGLPAIAFQTRELYEAFGTDDARRSSPYRFIFGASELKEAILPSRRAMLGVPSLNERGSSHYVYWTGEELIDPSPRKRYGGLAETVIFSAVVVLL